MCDSNFAKWSLRNTLQINHGRLHDPIPSTSGNKLPGPPNRVSAPKKPAMTEPAHTKEADVAFVNSGRGLVRDLDGLAYAGVG